MPGAQVSLKWSVVFNNQKKDNLKKKEGNVCHMKLEQCNMSMITHRYKKLEFNYKADSKHKLLL